VAEIEGYQKVINGAHAVIDNYRPHIPINPDWPMVKLGEVADLQAGFASGKSSVTEHGVPHIRPMNITDAGVFTWEGVKRISAEEFAGNEDKNLRRGDVLFNNTNSAELVGKTCLVPEDIDGGYSNHMTRLRPNAARLDPHFLALVLHGRWRTGYFSELATRWIGQAGINAKTLATVTVPFPPLATQQAIVAEIEAEQALVAANRELIARFEKKIQATLAGVWVEGA
jgi:type I restriction enzyme M protein